MDFVHTKCKFYVFDAMPDPVIKNRNIIHRSRVEGCSVEWS